MLSWNFSPHNSTFIFWPGTYPSQSNLITYHAKQISNLGFQLHEFHQAFFTIWKALNFLFQTFLCFLLYAISDFSNPPELFSQLRNQFHTIYHVVFSFIITFCLLKPGKISGFLEPHKEPMKFSIKCHLNDFCFTFLLLRFLNG